MKRRKPLDFRYPILLKSFDELDKYDLAKYVKLAQSTDDNSDLDSFEPDMPEMDDQA